MLHPFRLVTRLAVRMTPFAAVAALTLTGCGSQSKGISAPGPTATAPRVTAGTTAAASSSSAQPVATLGGASALPTAIGNTPGGVPKPSIDQLRETASGKVGPSVIRIENPGKGLGSGVIISPDGYIVTNNHVVSGAHTVRVTMANGHVVDATVIGVDPVDDLALVRTKMRNLPAAMFGNSSRLRVGQSVLAIGNPLGIGITVTDGIVSALARTVTEGQGGGSILGAVQTSAPINPGNSGGALINLAGQVVGIPTLTAVDPEFGTPANGVGFAIPSNTVERIVPQIAKYGHVVHSGRAAIGIFSEDVTPNLAAQYNLRVNKGVLVARLQPGGPAQRAGMEAGSVITVVDGREIATTGDLLDALSRHAPGETAALRVVTPSGSIRTYRLTLSELPVNGG